MRQWIILTSEPGTDVLRREHVQVSHIAHMHALQSGRTRLVMGAGFELDVIETVEQISKMIEGKSPE